MGIILAYTFSNSNFKRSLCTIMPFFSYIVLMVSQIFFLRDNFFNSMEIIIKGIKIKDSECVPYKKKYNMAPNIPDKYTCISGYLGAGTLSKKI